MEKIEWDNKNILKIGNEYTYDIENETDLRSKIEPWLTAIFQSEHISLLIGCGLTVAASFIAGVDTQDMGRVDFEILGEEIKAQADEQAAKSDRKVANFEDDMRVALELLKGLSIYGETDDIVDELSDEINKHFMNFMENIKNTEVDFYKASKYHEGIKYLKSFLVSFASRAASRDRLHIFTTNYDRLIEYACDMAGILILDRFLGKVNPVFRTNRFELDYHYNPPGIRGEPRYVEGVIRYTKLHGSLDWRFEGDKIVKMPLPFGKDFSYFEEESYNRVVIYPNSAKSIETLYFPYSELFRDFSSSLCRPNSVIVTYGYGFGDSHINRILEDMLTIPSTHMVIISYDKANGRIENFVKGINNSQLTILIGNHFGDLKTLVDNYIPKSAIDRISQRKQMVLERRGEKAETNKEMDQSNEE